MKLKQVNIRVSMVSDKLYEISRIRSGLLTNEQVINALKLSLTVQKEMLCHFADQRNGMLRE